MDDQSEVAERAPLNLRPETRDEGNGHVEVLHSNISWNYWETVAATASLDMKQRGELATFIRELVRNALIIASYRWDGDDIMLKDVLYSASCLHCVVPETAHDRILGFDIAQNFDFDSIFEFPPSEDANGMRYEDSDRTAREMMWMEKDATEQNKIYDEGFATFIGVRSHDSFRTCGAGLRNEICYDLMYWRSNARPTPSAFDVLQLLFESKAFDDHSIVDTSRYSGNVTLTYLEKIGRITELAFFGSDSFDDMDEDEDEDEDFAPPTGSETSDSDADDADEEMDFPDESVCKLLDNYGTALRRASVRILELETRAQSTEESNLRDVIDMTDEDNRASNDERAPTLRDLHVEALVDTVKEVKKEKIDLEARLEDVVGCVVCISNPRSIAVLPCTHACLCAGCAASIQAASGQCPICRANITGTVAFLLS